MQSLVFKHSETAPATEWPVAAYHPAQVAFQRRTKSTRRNKVLDKSQVLKWIVALLQFITYNHESHIYGLGAPNSAKTLAPHGGKGNGV